MDQVEQPRRAAFLAVALCTVSVDDHLDVLIMTRLLIFRIWYLDSVLVRVGCHG
jgi:hypothetical protein